MRKNQLIECVPNFSEGRDKAKLKQIAAEISSVKGVKLLDIDPGAATNRTVVTFVGHPEDVIEAAFLAIKKASEVIDMSQHKGEHPRMGATDVCPLIPIAGISMEETAEYAHKLAKRVGEELDIPAYMYENAATKEEWRNLATIRQGEYEALPEKMANPEWKPDYGPAKFNARAGATVIGARDFLVAYNVNLNTTSTRRANAIAFDIREKGRIKREGDPLNGKIIRDEAGQPLREPGKCKSVKAIGWFIEEYGIAQISMNLTNINITSLHEAYEACFDSALERGLRVSGSELIGLVPKKVMLDAGKYFLKKQERSCGISESEIIKIAVKSMGLDELAPFDPEKKIIEYLLEAEASNPLVNMTLTDFAQETASESPAPGGGSISAYVGTLGIALGNMVANLSAHKKGWDDRWEYFSDIAEKSQILLNELNDLVDADTKAFEAIMDAIRLPKKSDADKIARKKAIDDATIGAIHTPLSVMEKSLEAMDLVADMAEKGNPNSVSDAGVGALCLRTAVEGAWLNVKINAQGNNHLSEIPELLRRAKEVAVLARKKETTIMKIVDDKIG